MDGSHLSSSLQMCSFDCVFDDECVEMLFKRESQSGFGKNEPLVYAQWIKFARLDSISWILKTGEILGFGLETAYLSMTYFDLFISRQSIDIEKSWVIRLLSVACLSLAAKMKEVKVPGLSELKIEGYEFEKRVIGRMEVLVLNTLEWRMGLVTPFGYIHYFLTKLHKQECPQTTDYVSVSRLVVPIMREINLMRYRPSEIALAATLAAMDLRLTRSSLEFKINSISCWRFLRIEDVFMCYQLMKTWEVEKKQLHKFEYLQTDYKSVDDVENPSSKRKRLSFNECDKGYQKPNKKRLC